MIRLSVTHPELGDITVDVDGCILEYVGKGYLDHVYLDGKDVTEHFPRRSDARIALLDAMVADWRAKGGKTHQERWESSRPARRTA